MNSAPKLEFNLCYGSAAFRRRVEDIARSIDFGKISDSVIRPGTFFELRKVWSDKALGTLLARGTPSLSNPAALAAHQLIVRLCHLLGDSIYGQFSPAECETFFPENHIWILPKEGGFSIRSAGMRSESNTQGRVVFSSEYNQTVTIREKRYAVKFAFPHMSKRIQERLVTETGSYGARQRIHAFFSNLIYFREAELRDGGPAVVLFDACSMPVDSHFDVYIRKILWGGATSGVSSERHFFLAAYCPVDISNGKDCLLKTCLFPGFKQTPEAGLLEDSQLLPSEKHRLRTMAADGSAAAMLDRGEIDAVKWFHENGIPQVVKIDEEVFRY